MAVVFFWHFVWEVPLIVFALALAPMALHVVPPVLGFSLIAAAVGSVALVLGGFIGMGVVLKGDCSTSAWVTPAVMNLVLAVALIVQFRSIAAAVLVLFTALSVSAGMWLRLAPGDRRLSVGRLALAGAPAAILLVAGVVFIALGIRYYSMQTDALLPEVHKGEITVSVKRTGQLRVGDFAVFEAPDVPGRVLIRRVAATTGQKATARDGKTISVGPEAAWMTSAAGSGVPDSSDFGAVPTASVTDRVIAVIWPASRARLIDQ